ncbi:MAG: SRPBCC family protein [Balneolales bacterium]|nr:SRPBCC family protein [Balneolales bacterium]
MLMSSGFVKALKIAAIVFSLMIAVLLILAYTVNTKFAVERSVIINQPVEEVFDYVKYLRNQFNYSVWGGHDPDMIQDFRGTDGTVGFISAWSGNEEAGSGEQEIVGIIEGERIDYELRFFEPFESTSNAYMTTEAITENETRVSWGMFGSMPRPMNLLLIFMNLEEAIGNDYETGLNNLKAILESTGS